VRAKLVGQVAADPFAAAEWHIGPNAASLGVALPRGGVLACAPFWTAAATWSEIRTLSHRVPLAVFAENIHVPIVMGGHDWQNDLSRSRAEDVHRELRDDVPAVGIRRFDSTEAKPLPDATVVVDADRRIVLVSDDLSPGGLVEQVAARVVGR
jgi:hypothetical protein